MKSVLVLAGGLLAGCLAAVTAVSFWHGDGGMNVIPEPDPTVSKDAGIPEIAPEGPYPKAVVKETFHDFGVMEYGQKGKRTFVITNEGEAPLEMVARPEDSTCGCTIGSVSDGKLAPGESTEIELTWTIKSHSPNFSNTAKVRTNDPDYSEVDFRVIGRVDQVLNLVPGATWETGHIPTGETIGFEGSVYSRILDEFQIEEIEFANPHMSAEAIPLSESELEKLSAKCGYSLKGMMLPQTDHGPFRERMTLKTNVRDGLVLPVDIVGTLAAPIMILPTAGVRWSAENMTMDLGRFKAEEGKKGKLLLYVASMEKDFECQIETDRDELNLSIERDPNFHSDIRQKFFIHVEVIGNNLPRTSVNDTAAKVTLRTNHSKFDAITFDLSYLSL